MYIFICKGNRRLFSLNFFGFHNFKGCSVGEFHHSPDNSHVCQSRERSWQSSFSGLLSSVVRRLRVVDAIRWISFRINGWPDHESICQYYWVTTLLHSFAGLKHYYICRSVANPNSSNASTKNLHRQVELLWTLVLWPLGLSSSLQNRYLRHSFHQQIRHSLEQNRPHLLRKTPKM